MTENLRPITRALISLSDKSGLKELAALLRLHEVEVLSTGGTAKALRDEGLAVTDVSDYTGFPEMLDGRVKTLHPKIHGGLLARLDLTHHTDAMKKHDIQPIDLVVVNLYPFEETVARLASFDETIETIDIGGPSMVRSGAKNHAFCTVITDPADYPALQAELEKYDGSTSLDFRKKMAAKAYARTATYDAAISQWFTTQVGELFPERFALGGERSQLLRYGENPDQQAAFYVTGGAKGVGQALQIQGKELSYNNINDADAALELVSEFDEPACAIIKHANPCGIAIGKDPLDAYTKALACDPVSAFGSIVAFNRELTEETAAVLSKLFVEVIIAPGADEAARSYIAQKKNLRLLLVSELPDPLARERRVKSVTGGFLVQERDNVRIMERDLQVVTKRQPTEEEIRTMLFAFTVCKHVKSNAIVFAKEGATIGIGAGQMSRVDSVRIAALKASDGEGNATRAKGAVVASDAFFPFADGLLQAADAGITAAIQPGGSVRDEEVIAAADARGMAMVFTGKRHFKH